MKLTGDQRKQLEEALLSAFPSKSDLERMVLDELGENLDVISSGESLKAVTFDLIKWANANGKLDDLVRGAKRANPGNPDLQTFIRDVWDPGQADPIRSGSPLVPPGNLPNPLDSFIGRDREKRRVKQLLATCRLLILRGEGGVGKTRLAIQVANDVRGDFPDGVWFVDLQLVDNPEMVIPSIAQALDVKEVGGHPLLVRLTAYLQNKQLLLVIDNFEQVKAAAEQIAKLLESAPNVKVLITSRSPLDIHGEQLFKVRPFPLPDPRHHPTTKQLQDYDVIQLFVERVRRIEPDFQINDSNAESIAEICSLLDGLPLAVELATARITTVRTPQALLQQLKQHGFNKVLKVSAGNRAPRQHTLSNTIAWSYKLLEESEQTFFACLAVFAGSFSLEAADKVCNPEGNLELDTLDMVDSLLDKALLGTAEAPDDARFIMLQTIRKYAWERLEDTGKLESYRRMHAEYFLKLAKEAEPQLWGSEQRLWLGRMAMEHDNLRAAIAWSLEQPERADIALSMTGALALFWLIRGHLSEGRSLLENALNASPKTLKLTPELIKARAGALFGLGRLVWAHEGDEQAEGFYKEAHELYQSVGDNHRVAWSLHELGKIARDQGEAAAAESYFEQSLALFQGLDDATGIAWSYQVLGVVARNLGDLARATTLCNDSLELFEKIGDQRGIAWSLHELGLMKRYEGNYKSAEESLRESICLFCDLGDDRGIAWSNRSLGNVLRDRGDLDGAITHHEEALRLFRALGEQRGSAWTLYNRGTLALDQRRYSDAMRMQKEALEQFENLGDMRGVASAKYQLGIVARYQGELEWGKALLEESLKLFLNMEDARGAASSLHNLGLVALYERDYQRAARLLGVAATQWKLLNMPLPPADLSAYVDACSLLRQELTEDVFNRVSAEAAGWSIEEVMQRLFGQLES